MYRYTVVAPEAMLYVRAFFFVAMCIKIYAVPPEACFSNFRWEDCGKAPVRVLYYWKPGSRCEVGVWRGCLPNMNMFSNEYECVSTCIFTARAEAKDYHNLIEQDIIESSTTFENITVTEPTDAMNSTGPSGNLTTTIVDEGNSTDNSDSTGQSAYESTTPPPAA